MEGLGFDPLMISDHIAVTPDVAEQYPAPFYEPFTTLAWLAGITGRIRLGTTVLIVPYRHPLLIARMAANLSQGPLRSYWPGAAYVNWVGLDGYYDLPLSNFRNVFVRTIRVVRQFTHDPVLISESAIGQRAGQARKIPNLLRGVLTGPTSDRAAGQRSANATVSTSSRSRHVIYGARWSKRGYRANM